MQSMWRNDLRMRQGRQVQLRKGLQVREESSEPQVTAWRSKTRKPLANPPRTEGLTALDRDRASSIADEGGTSAAAVEAQRPPTSTSAPVEADETDLDATPAFPMRAVEKR